MFNVIKEDFYWVIQDSSTGELVCKVEKTGQIGLKSNLPKLEDKRMVIKPLMFGFYDKASAILMCQKLNKEEEPHFVRVKRPMHSSYESEYDSFYFETLKEAEDFKKYLIEDGVLEERIKIERQ